LSSTSPSLSSLLLIFLDHFEVVLLDRSCYTKCYDTTKAILFFTAKYFNTCINYFLIPVGMTVSYSSFTKDLYPWLHRISLNCGLNSALISKFYGRRGNNFLPNKCMRNHRRKLGFQRSRSPWLVWSWNLPHHQKRLLVNKNIGKAKNCII